MDLRGGSLVCTASATSPGAMLCWGDCVLSLMCEARSSLNDERCAVDMVVGVIVEWFGGIIQER